jgi:hypothetical protein
VIITLDQHKWKESTSRNVIYDDPVEFIAVQMQPSPAYSTTPSVHIEEEEDHDASYI